RPRPPGRDEGHPGMAELLLQEPAARPEPLPRARPVHPANQAEEHAPLDDGRGADHPPGHGVLRRLSSPILDCRIWILDWRATGLVARLSFGTNRERTGLTRVLYCYLGTGVTR